MYQFSISMALVDYIPVVFFGAAALLLQRDLYNKMSAASFALFAAGTINIFCAGLLKASWKLLYAAGVCDFQALNTLFLPLQSIGFLLAGLGLATMFVRRKQTAALAVPPVFGGSLIFIAMMVLGLGCICTCLSLLAARLKRRGAAVLFVLCFLCSMGMGYMSSRDSTLAVTNWIEQGINCVGQGLLLWGTVVLHKAGLSEYKFT